MEADGRLLVKLSFPFLLRDSLELTVMATKPEANLHIIAALLSGDGDVKEQHDANAVILGFLYT